MEGAEIGKRITAEKARADAEAKQRARHDALSAVPEAQEGVDTDEQWAWIKDAKEGKQESEYY